MFNRFYLMFLFFLLLLVIFSSIVGLSMSVSILLFNRVTKMTQLVSFLVQVLVEKVSLRVDTSGESEHLRQILDGVGKS